MKETEQEKPDCEVAASQGQSPVDPTPEIDKGDHDIELEHLTNALAKGEFAYVMPKNPDPQYCITICQGLVEIQAALFLEYYKATKGKLSREKELELSKMTAREYADRLAKAIEVLR